MIKMRGHNYREAKGMPYVRREFIRSVPQSKIARFSTGKNQEYNTNLKLMIAKGRGQIRHNAIEAARVSANKKLGLLVGEENYYLSVKVFPHIILRENKMIATAGADRLQEGMRRSFGKSVGLAARVRAGSIIIEVKINRINLEKAKTALKISASKLPMPTKIVVST
jgi:large subunit ribosomal protein L10e